MLAAMGQGVAASTALAQPQFVTATDDQHAEVDGRQDDVEVRDHEIEEGLPPLEREQDTEEDAAEGTEEDAYELDARLLDAGSDHVILFPTADTHPKGTIYFSDYELALLQVGYALTDSIQLSVTGLPPLVEGLPYFADISGKVTFLRITRFRAAGYAGVIGSSMDNEFVYGGRAGAVGQYCFSDSCRSSMSFGVGTLVSTRFHDTVPVHFSMGLVARVSDVVALLLEPTFVTSLGADPTEGLFVAGGVRFSSGNFAFDLTAGRLFGIYEGTLPFPVILPMLSITYRTTPSPEEPSETARRPGQMIPF